MFMDEASPQKGEKEKNKEVGGPLIKPADVTVNCGDENPLSLVEV